ncbi:MAG: hypothetical protein AAGA99_09665 [Actinomycetota bacterium]
MSRRALALAVAVTLLAAACADDDTGDAAPTTVEPTTTASSPTTNIAPTTTAAATTAPATTAIPTTTATPATTVLAGEPIELFAQSGQVWSVVGVDREDVLNVRSGPGVDADIVATLAPTAAGVVTTGRAQALSSSIWYEVEVDGVAGWVNIAFLALPGVVTDETAAVEAALGALPVAETLVDLGTATAAVFASDEPASDVVVSVAPTIGDLGEITIDVMGLGDDAQVGWRLRLFAVEDEAGEFFTLRTVEAVTLCGRGVTDDLRCT